MRFDCQWIVVGSNDDVETCVRQAQAQTPGSTEQVDGSRTNQASTPSPNGLEVVLVRCPLCREQTQPRTTPKLNSVRTSAILRLG